MLHMLAGVHWVFAQSSAPCWIVRSDLNFEIQYKNQKANTLRVEGSDMTPIHALQRVWNDNSWKIPIVAGIVAIPMVIVLQVLTDGLAILAPPFLGGLLVGMWAVETHLSSARVGWRSGLVCGLSLLYGGASYLESTAQIWLDAPSALLTIFTLTGVLGVLIIAVAVFGVVGAVGGIIGNWIYKRSNWFERAPS